MGSHTAEQVRTQCYIWQGEVTAVPVGLLSDAVDLLLQHPHPVELQLDLKPDVFHSNAVLSQLTADLQPVKDRVRATSPADWALRRLRAIDPDLALGFDPLLYLDVTPHQTQVQGLAVPPLRQGAYGYWDDHPLAIRRWGEKADYLAARAEALWAQAPPGAIWYIRAKLLAQALEDGFDWIDDLHHRGARVVAWTLNADRPSDVELAHRLAMAGVDRITTDDPPALAQALAESAQGSVYAEY